MPVGQLGNSAKRELQAIFPGLAIFVVVLGINLLGDGLRDALDPRMKAVADL